MAGRRALVSASAVLSVTAAIASCFREDFFWLAVSGFALLSLAFPATIRSGKPASSALVAWTLVPPVLQLALIAADMAVPWISDGSAALNDVPLFVYLSSFNMALQGFVSGFSMLVVANASGIITISRSWMLVFAMMASLGVSAFCMFYEYGWMWLSGYPVSESDLARLPEGKFMNGLMMASPIVAVLSTPLFFVAGRLLVLRRPREALWEDMP